MSDFEMRLREAEARAGAVVSDERLVSVSARLGARARRVRLVRMATTVAASAVAVAGLGVGGWWIANDAKAGPAGEELPGPQGSMTPTVEAPPTDGDLASQLLVPVDEALVKEYFGPVAGPALVTGSMPASAAYGDAATPCGDDLALCDHPAAPDLTADVLATADERWAVALYSQAPSGAGPESTGGGSGIGPAGLYLVGPAGESYFVAAGDPAVGAIFAPSVSAVAWAPGRASAVIGGSLAIDGSGAGGFTLVELLTGASTTVFPECSAVQASAEADGWLLRALCPEGDVAAHVSDAGKLLSTDGVLVADEGFAVSVGVDYLVVRHENDEAASAFDVVTPSQTVRARGDYCYQTDEGRAVVCTTDEGLIVTSVGLDGEVSESPVDPAFGDATGLELCTVGEVPVAVTTVDEPEYLKSVFVGRPAVRLFPDSISEQQSVTCAAAGGGTGYFYGNGGVWAYDTATGAIARAIAAPDETYAVTDEWNHEGVRVVSAAVIVGGPGFVSLG